MHLIALSWDVDRPGQPDPAVLALARAVRGHGSSCEVVTLGEGPSSTHPVHGVDVTWVAEAPPVLPSGPREDLSRVLAAASRVSAMAERRCRERPPDAVLALGWHTAWTATTLRAARGLPVVAVLDSIAPGRADGDLDAAGRLVAQVEWWLTYEARRVVVPVAQLRTDLRRAYRLPAAKVDVVPAGARVAPVGSGMGATVVGDTALARSVRAAVGSRAGGDAGIVVVLDDGAVRAVVDAMAAGAAVVVPDDGPLRGLVHAGRSGLRVPRDRAAVVEAVRRLQKDPRGRARMGSRARDRVAQRHDWSDVAARVLAVAEVAVEEERTLAGAATPDRPLRPQLLRSPLLHPVREEGSTRTNAGHGAEGRG